MNTEAIRRRLLTFASENHPKDGKKWLARKSHPPCGAAIGTQGKGKRNDDNGIPPAKPLSADSGFPSQTESSTIGSAARAEILPTGRQWLDDLGRNLCLHPADVSKALPTSAGRWLWFRPVFFQERIKNKMPIGDTSVSKQCLRLVR